MEEKKCRFENWYAPIRSYVLCIALCDLFYGFTTLFNWTGGYQDYYTAFPTLIVYKNVFVFLLIMASLLGFYVSYKLKSEKKKFKPIAVYVAVFFGVSTFLPPIYEIICDFISGLHFGVVSLLPTFVCAIFAVKSIQYLNRNKDVF